MTRFEFKNIFDFLELIEENNNREWFNSNKELYLSAKADFDDFVSYIGCKIEKLDPQFSFTNTKDYTYRIYRDVRFSKNKLPYKDHFGAFLSVGGRKSPLAGYYFHFKRGGSFYGGGVYRPQKDVLKSIRQEIYYSYKEFDNLINDKPFKNIFPRLMEDKLKKGPKDFPKDSPAIEFLKYKSFAVAHQLSDSEVFDKEFVPKLLKAFGVLKPLNDYLNNAINLAEGNHI